MRRFENFLVFHADAGEIVGVEKAAVVDVVGSDPPVGQAESLRLDELMQLFEAGRIGGRSICRSHCIRDTSNDLGSARTQLREAPFVDLLIAVALDDALMARFLS